MGKDERRDGKEGGLEGGRGREREGMRERGMGKETREARRGKDVEK